MDELTPVTDVPLCPDRPVDAHKGTFGTVVVVGGCPTMIGAPALCAGAALRGGAGLVKIATDRRMLSTAIAIEPGATGVSLSGKALADVAAIDRADPDHRAVLAVGPGIGTETRSGRLVIELLGGKRSVVLDADGLNLLAATSDVRPTFGGGDLIMTPHPGEFARLAQPWSIARSPTDPAQRPASAFRCVTPSAVALSAPTCQNRAQHVPFVSPAVSRARGTASRSPKPLCRQVQASSVPLVPCRPRGAPRLYPFREFTRPPADASPQADR